MRKLSLILLVIMLLALPGMGVFSTMAWSGNCAYSFATQFTAPTTGHIAQAFSTFRHSPAGADVVRVLAPAEFDVLDQLCVDGLSWIQLEYTSGTTATGGAASALGIGWALESQIYADFNWGPGTWLAPGAAPAPGTGSCQYSFATNFGPTGAAAGEIAEAFSTLRSAPGATSGTRVLAPATFDVISQGCFGGFSWVEIQYTSGTTASGGSAAQLAPGWALESQIYPDALYNAGTWLIP